MRRHGDKRMPVEGAQPPRWLRWIPRPQFSLMGLLISILLGMCLIMIGQFFSWGALVAVLVPAFLTLVVAVFDE